MDVKEIRRKFPIYKVQKKSFIYFDTAATSQRPQGVCDRVYEFYAEENASVHRGVYDLSEQATQHYEDAREKVARFINADSNEIVFTRGTTEGINFIADTWGRDHLVAGDEIVVTHVEHHANLLPWQRLAKRTGAILKFITINDKDFLLNDPESGLINDKTKLVALVHVSNVIGNVWREGQLQSVIEQAHRVGAKVLLDGAQSVPHQKVDVRLLDPDFFVFSGHKMLGPTGIGVLYIKKELHDEVEPYQLGGSMVREASFFEARWLVAPGKFEAGTPPIAGAIGLGSAIDFFNEHVDFADLAKHETMLCARMIDGLKSMGGVRILGNEAAMKTHGHLVAFMVDGIHGHDIAGMLAMRNIAVRAGHHCVQPFATLLGIESSVRASFYLYNTLEEIDGFIKVLQEVIKAFRGA